MKKIIATILSAVMTISTVCFTTVVKADDSEKKTYIVQLSESPVYEAGDDGNITLYGNDTVQSREYKIQSEQKAFKSEVKSKTNSNIVYQYDQVFNGMAVEATDEEIEVIKNMPNVKAVYESMSYDAVTPEVSSADGEVSNDLGKSVDADGLRDAMNELEPNSGDGEGMVIAIVDSEFDINHEAFSLTDDSEIKLTKANLQDSISDLSISDLTVNKVYKNEKVPFAYDYVNKNTDVYSEAIIHGTHVAGIAAGNSDNLRGLAPNAQLVLMKCTDNDGSIWSAAMIAGINDAVKMGVDVINLSIGASYANCSENDPYIEVMRNVAASPTELFCSAGNSGLGADENANKASASEVAYDTGGCPAGTKDVPVVGNAYSTKISNSYNSMSLYDADGNESGEIYYANAGGSDFAAAFKDKKYEVVAAGYGLENDYNGVDAEGKIVVVKYGGGTASDLKKQEILKHGGIGMIFVYNKESLLRDMEGFPSAIMDDDDYETLVNSKYIQTSDKITEVASPQQMHSSSSYAINEYLDGGVQLSARGTDVVSSVPNDEYESFNGTSMASPMAAGAYALVKSYLKNKSPDLDSDTADFTTLCINMMQNTADIIYNPNQSVSAPYTPRAQGAGYINLSNLAKSDVVVSDVKSGKGMVYCGATEENEVSFKLSLKNLSDEAVTYNNISGIAIRDYVDDDGYINYASVKVNAGFEMDGSVTVPANGEVDFPVTVFIRNATRNNLDAIFENGFFLDGFITFKGDNVQTVSIPFTSFIGDYFKAPVFNYDDDMYPTPYLGYSNNSEYLEAATNEETDRIVISENKESNLLVGKGYTPEVGAYFLRGAQTFSGTVKNSNGNAIYKYSYADVSKYSIAGIDLDDAFKDEKEGEYSVTIDAVLNSDKSGNTVDTQTFDVYLDNTAPVIESVSEDEENDTLKITASDNYGLTYAEVKGTVDDKATRSTANFELIDGAYTATLDLSKIGESYNIYVYDYAYNYATPNDKTSTGNITVTNVGESYTGSILKKEVKIRNNTKLSKTATPILAIYDKDGKLLKTVVNDAITINSSSLVKYTFSVKLTEPDFPGLKLPEGATTKVFLWDSLDDMTPIAANYSE
jgi:lactocepin